MNGSVPPIPSDPVDLVGAPAPEQLPSERVQALLDEFRVVLHERRMLDLRCARILATLGENRGWETVGCASVGEVGERHGIAAAEARGLLDLGRAIRTTPLLEDQVANGKVTVAAASCVAAVLATPEMLRPDDDWIGWAQSESTRTLRARIRRRQEEVRIGDEPPCPLTVHIRARARDDFARARSIASRRAGRAVTQGETFETLVDHYLDSFDEDRVSPGKRRSPPTALVNGRHIPVSVRREIFERQGRACAAPYCDHALFLEMAHLRAHAKGGDREADNLILLCSLHHELFDRGLIQLVGTAASPRFIDSNGRDMAERFDPGGGERAGVGCTGPDSNHPKGPETKGPTSAGSRAGPPGASSAAVPPLMDRSATSGPATRTRSRAHPVAKPDLDRSNDAARPSRPT